MRRLSPPGLTLTALALAVGCSSEPEDAPSPQAPDASPERCVDDRAFFDTELWPQTLQPSCASCHSADGLARTSQLVFLPPSRPDHLSVNREVLTDVAGLSRDGTSIVLRKPLGLDNHGGGVIFSDEEDAGYQQLVAFVERLADPVTCDVEEEVFPDDAGLELLSAELTLRKAAQSLAGVVPSDDALRRVRDGGESALVSELWHLMGEERFLDVFMERLNDHLLTDRYLRGTDAIGTFDQDRYPSVLWYQGLDDGNRARNGVNAAIAREPLQLAAHILRHDLPWTDFLTANYTVADPFLRRAWGLSDGPVAPEDPSARHTWEALQVPDFAHVGFLSTPAFLNRFPTTPTNRNRHRAWFFLKAFLATDILTYSDRPLDAEDETATHNPTLNDPQCTICHAALDPVAGLFQNHDERGRYRPPSEGWFADMIEPGFERQVMPAANRPDALRWLAEQTVADPRFATATVRLVLQMLTGLEPLDSATAGTDPDRLAALRLQDRFVQQVAQELPERGWDLKYAIERVVLSRYFRAQGAGDPVEGALVQAGTARLLSPEALHRRIESTLGMPWSQRHNTTPFLLDRYRLLYGGIDSFSVVDRLTHPNGVTQAIAESMATWMSCRAVPRDFLLDASQRRLFPHVEPSFRPRTDDGFAVPEAEDAIRRNLQHLHLLLLHEPLALDDPELQHTYDLWVDVWQQGQDALSQGDVGSSLDWNCQARTDPWTGEDLPTSRQVRSDPHHTIRAWMAVLSYLLQDWRFLHE